LLQVACISSLVICFGGAHAEVEKTLYRCGANKLCPFLKLTFTPPDGWVIDKEATDSNKIQIMVPKGTHFSNAQPLIYVKVSWHKDKQESLAELVRVSNEHWQTSSRDTKISERPVVERTNGKPAFLSFFYENPGKTQQAYEVVSFGLDSDNDNNEFVVMVSMTANSKKAIERADKDYVAFLAAH
jgi:hypothetical protein